MDLKIAIVCERMLLGFGADLVYHKLAEGLHGKGCQVTVFTTRSDGTYENSGYKISLLPVPADANFPAYEKNASRFLHFLIAQGFDLFVLGTFPFYSYAQILSRHAPCIAVDLGICSTDGMPASVKRNFDYMRETQYGEYFNYVEKILTISEYLKKLMPEHLKEKTKALHLGIDHYGPNAPKDMEKFRNDLGISDDEVLLLYVGRLNPKAQPYKGTAQLVEIYKKLKERHSNVKLIMAGFGDEKDENFIRSEGIIPMLNVPVKSMPALYGACDIYVTASSWEGFDLPLLEAQYFGKPGVALKIGAHPEVVREGETSFLAENTEEIVEKLDLLIRDKDKRVEMGEKARLWAKNFKWDEKISQYVEAIVETADCFKKEETKGVQPKVTALVLNYNADFEILEECILTLKAQTYKNLEILIVDNNSTNGSLEHIQKKFEGLRILKLDQNHGFSVGNNRGIEASEGEFIFILNFDVKLHPSATEELVKVIQTDGKIIAVAPKMLLYRDPEIIDCIGNLLTPAGDAFNMGIGQIDIGQYDVSERVFGACFGAALVRKSGFKEDAVGALEERFFMYYEDVDWNYRANALGYKIVTAPKAVVYHHHSAATKKFSYDMKYELIQLNLLRTVFQNVQGRKVVAKLIMARLKNHVISILRKQYRKASLKVLWKFLLDIPDCVKKRNELKKRRVVDDMDIFKYSYGEIPFFDPVAYAPIKSLDTLEFIYSRKCLVDADPKYQGILNYLRLIKFNKLRFEREVSRSMLDELFMGEPERIKTFCKEINW